MQRDLAAAQEPGNQTADFAQVQFRPGGTGRPEGDAHELQPRQRLGRTGGDDLERIGAHGGVALVLQNLQAVDHGPQRPHQIVAHPADQKRREIKVVHRVRGSGP